MGQKRTCRLSRHLVWAAIWLVLCIAWEPAAVQAQDPPGGSGTSDGSSKEQSEEKLTYMMENPLLRQFFADQITGRSLGQRPQPLGDEFFERVVDMQIESFGKKVDQDLTELLATTDSARQLRERWVRAKKDPERKEAAAALAVVLRRVADRADGLADLLQAVFTELRRNKKLDLTIENSDADDGYLRQMTFIEEQVAKSEQLIRDYLFRPAQTIRLTDLSSENMLVRLDWVESVAKRVADKLL